MKSCSLRRSKLPGFEICEKHCCNFIVTFRFGKKRLEVMASTLASEDYVKSHARQCPHCNAPIEKNDGCNKVILGLYCNEIKTILIFVRSRVGDAALTSAGCAARGWTK